MIMEPPRWTHEQLHASAAAAIVQFRIVRLEEPLELYLEFFDHYRDTMETLLEGTLDLSSLSDQAVELLSDPDMLYAVRYLASPPISDDDLKVLAEAVLTPKRLKLDPEMARRVVQTVLMALDRNRFPWVGEDREPTNSERYTAMISTVALIATQKTQTARRSTSKQDQEQAVADALVACGFKESRRREITNMQHLPEPGHFYRETPFAGRKADLVVRMWDGRAMPIECKVSNSATNSVKRLNNDAAAKAVVWLHAFGGANTVPAAVLSGVFKVHNLETAQTTGLTLFWAHDLEQLTDFLDAAR